MTTVGKLIKALQKFDPETKVYSYNNVTEDGAELFALKEMGASAEFPYCKADPPDGLPSKYLILFAGYNYTASKYYRMGEVFNRKLEFKNRYGVKL